MRNARKVTVALVGAMVLSVVVWQTSPAPAQPAGAGAEIVVTCPETGPGIGVCAGLIVLMHELQQAAQGKKPFGKNGEVMKLLKAPIDITEGNVKGAKRESGELAKAIRVTTGISVKDIDKYGPLGGANSEARQICNAIAGVAGGKC